MEKCKLICPSCPREYELIESEEYAQCQNCKHTWPRVDGVLQFADDIYWGEAPEADIKNFISDIQRDGLDEASAKFQKANPGMYNFSFDPARADWRYGIDIKSTDHVLDAGCGMGAHVFGLCDEVEKVVACDLSATRIQFVKERAKAQGKTNVETYVADFMELPFNTGTFDVIVFNGLLEWVSQSKKFKNPKQVQEWVIKRCYELLKPGGRLYIGIENRWAFTYFTGGIDHSSIAYTSLMPRFMANAYCKLRLGKEYRTYTHGKNGYEKMLLKGGFKEIKSMLVYPGYNDPRILIPFDDISALKYAICNLMGRLTWKKRLIKKIVVIPGVLWAYRYIFYSYAIFGIKKI